MILSKKALSFFPKTKINKATSLLKEIDRWNLQAVIQKMKVVYIENDNVENFSFLCIHVYPS